MKKKIIAIIILVAIAAIAATAGILVNNKINKPKESDEKNNSVNQNTNSLPQVIVYYEQESVGTLRGYTMEIKTEMLRDNLVVVKSDNRKLSMDINVEGLKVDSAKYEVKSVEDKRLIDNGEITEMTGANGPFEIPISAILDINTEYLFVITIQTEEFGEVYYYSRLMIVEEEFISAQIAFAKEFSDSTMDDQKATGLVIYMEPDEKLLNNNLGRVSLKNNYASITWGNLIPEKITETEVEIKEIYVKDTGFSGTYQMKYQVQAEGNKETIDKYEIIETITVWTFAEKQYVLAYERTMNQIWEADENTIRNSFIDLGIQTETEVNYLENVKGKCVAYTVNGQLWLAELAENKMRKIYEIKDKDEDATKITLSSVDEEGNVDFIVYGYHTGASHRGMNGISVCSYNKESNSVEEKLFVPHKEPAAILAGQIGKLSYMNDEVLYIAINDVVYYVNLVTKEKGKLTENLQDGNHAINGAKNTIAYHTNGVIYDSDSITVSNLEDNTNQVIEAGAGNKIKVLGYVGNHLVYGIASEKNIDANKGVMNMHVIKVVDENLSELVSYEKEKVLITGVEIADSMINITRIKKGQPIEDDQLIDNTEKKEFISTSSYYDDTKKYRELALSLEINIGTLDEVSIIDAGISGNVAEPVDFVENKETSDWFYVYACGTLKEICDDRETAEVLAKEYDGLVVNGIGQKIWTFEENYE